MIDIKIKGDIDDLFNLNWFDKTKEDWTEVLSDENKKMWSLQVDPKGLPWRALSPSYEKWKRKNFGPLPILKLKSSGGMLDDASLFTLGDQIKVKTTSYGIFHQRGTDKMPARTWMGIPDTAMRALPEIALKHILK